MKKSYPYRIYQCIIIFLVYSLVIMASLEFKFSMQIELMVIPLAMIVIPGLFRWSINKVYKTPFVLDFKMPTKQTIKFTLITAFFVVLLYIFLRKVSEIEFFQYPNTWYFFLSMAILAPLAEEFLFRGIFLKGLLQSYKIFWAILFSSIFFALLHYDIAKTIDQNIPSIGLAFFMGIILGVMYVKTKNLWSSLFLHLSINVVGIII